MSEITLHGAYKTRNFGDLLLLQIQLRIAREAGITTVNMPSLTGEILQWLEVPAGLNFRKGYGGVLIFGAGGYLGAPASSVVKWTYNWTSKHLMLVLRALMQKDKVYIVGPGAGPFPPFPLALILKRLFSKAEAILVRDDESADSIRALLGHDKQHRKLKAGADLALIMYSPSKGYENSLKAVKTVGLHLSPPLGRETYLADFIDQLAAAIRSIDAPIEFVCLVDQVGTNGAKRQEATAKMLADRLSITMTTIRFGGVNQFCNAIDACDLIITTKLHVGIVARAFDKPVIAVPTHLKTKRFYKQIGESQCCFEWEKLEKQGFYQTLRDELHQLGRRSEIPEEVRQRAVSTARAFSDAAQGRL